MARTVWDDEDDGADKAKTTARPPPPPAGSVDARSPTPSAPELNHDLGGDFDTPSGRGRGSFRLLPWLLAGLAGAGLAATMGRNLHEGERQRASLSAARDEAAEFRRGLFVAEEKLAAVERDRAAKIAAAAQLAETVASHGKQLDETQRVIADLRAQLDAKEGEVSSDANQISVNLVDQILFKSGEAELSPKGKQVLDHVGSVLKKLGDKQILIGGHTDSRPIHTERFPSNWELSSARAVNVVRYLEETVGVDPARLTAAGYSQFHPRGRSLAKNRRIEILLTPMVAVKKVGG